MGEDEQDSAPSTFDMLLPTDLLVESSEGSTSRAAMYDQVRLSDDPFVILGIDSAATPAEVRSAYRHLALALHPDKAHSPELLELHHELFLKVSQALDDAVTALSNAELAAVDLETRSFSSDDHSPEAVRKRVQEFKQALREAREEAIFMKHYEEICRAALEKGREGQIAAWERTLAENKARSKASKTAGVTVSDVIQQAKQRSKQQKLEKKAERRKTPRESPAARKKEKADDDKMRAAEKRAAMMSNEIALVEANPSSSATPSFYTKVNHDGIGATRKYDDYIRGRWNKALLSGNPRNTDGLMGGSLSFIAKEQRDHSFAAMTKKADLMQVLARQQEFNRVYKIAVQETGNTLPAQALEDRVGEIMRAKAVEEERLFTWDGRDAGFPVPGSRRTVL